MGAYEKMTWYGQDPTAIILLNSWLKGLFLPSFPGIAIWYDIRLHLHSCTYTIMAGPNIN